MSNAGHMWFRGAGDFVGNQYAIYAKGLGDDKPNYLALNQGIGNRRLLLDKSYEDVIFNDLIAQLNTIAENEAAKERNYLDQKLEQLQTQLGGPNDLLGHEYIYRIKNAIIAGDYNAAFTLINRQQKDLISLREQLNSSKFNMQHNREFWSDQFATFFLNKFYENIGEKYHPDFRKLDVSNLTVENIVDEYFKQVLEGSNNIIEASFASTKEKFKDELLKLLVSKKVTKAKDYTDKIFPNKKADASKVLKILKPNYKGKVTGDVLKKISNIVAFNVANGMSQELATMRNITSNSGISIGLQTGQVKNASGKSIKSDVIYFETFSGDIPAARIKNAGDIILKDGINYESLENLRKKITALSNFKGSDLFEISVNVKGYRSRNKLQIKGKSSFEATVRNMQEIVGKIGSSALGKSLSILMFLLVNTTQGCIADKQIDNIGEFIAAACTAWMWDDYTELFSLAEGKGTTKKIHLFNSGGAYLSASQIIKQTIIKLNGKSDLDLVDVEINTAGPLSKSAYEKLKKAYLIENANDEQAVLKQRWDTERDRILAEGSVSIHLYQSSIEQMLGYLRSLI